MRLLPLFFLLIFVNFSNGETKKECYTVRYIFVPVGKLCIQYSFDHFIKIKAEAHTTGIFKILKDIKYSGYAVSNNDLTSKLFFFRRQERGLIEIHRYEFSKDWIDYHKILIKGADEKTINKKIKNKDYLDPFTGSFYYYKQIRAGKPVRKSIFFNGKGYFVPYFNRKIKRIKINNKNFECYYAEIDPSKIKVGGILQPTGIWKLYIDKEKNRLIKGILKIKAGKVVIEKN